MSRSYVRSHEPILVEWLTKTYPLGSWRTNVRLGNPTPELEAHVAGLGSSRILEVVMFTADAVVFLANEVHIIEVITERKVGDICQVKLYAHLFKTTEKFREYWDKKVIPIIVSPVDSPLIQAFARREGVRWIQYQPIWWAEHIAIRQARKFTGPSVEVPKSLKE